jgi:hypothetical protein
MRGEGPLTVSTVAVLSVIGPYGPLATIEIPVKNKEKEEEQSLYDYPCIV